LFARVFLLPHTVYTERVVGAAGPASSDRQSYHSSQAARTNAVSLSPSRQQQKPRKTLTYAEQLQSLQKPKDSYYNQPSMTVIRCIVRNAELWSVISWHSCGLAM